jgi:DnaJ-class molecular chaperone
MASNNQQQSQTSEQRDAGSHVQTSNPAQSVNPGDEAPRGTPGTGEDICPECRGSGRIGGSECPNCGGTGKVTTGIGGA